MDNKMKQIFMLVTYGVILFIAGMNLDDIILFLQKILGIFLPLGLGFLLAFVLAVPMNGFEKIIRRASAGNGPKLKDKTVHTLSLLLTFTSIILVFIVVCTIVIPEIVASVKSIGIAVAEKWPEWMKILNSYDIDTVPIAEWMESVDFEHLFTKFASNAGNLVNVLAGTAVSTASMIATGTIAIIIMFYVLLSKNDLTRQGRMLLYANCKKEVADRIVYMAVLARNTYTKFLSGQCVEAIILGLLMFCAFSLLRLPYAGIVSILASVCAFIPYIGAFLSCGIGVFLTAISSPQQAIVCLFVYISVQFVENQFIYPRVVGTSVGLSPLWTLLAAMAGGKLMGLVGIIFFIPLTAVIYTLVRENTTQKLRKKGLLGEG